MQALSIAVFNIRFICAYIRTLLQVIACLYQVMVLSNNKQTEPDRLQYLVGKLKLLHLSFCTMSHFLFIVYYDVVNTNLPNSLANQYYVVITILQSKC